MPPISIMDGIQNILPNLFGNTRIITFDDATNYLQRLSQVSVVLIEIKHLLKVHNVYVLKCMISISTICVF